MPDVSRARRTTDPASKATADVTNQARDGEIPAGVVADAAGVGTGSSSALLRKAHDLLAERGESLGAGELARVVFGLGALPESARATWVSMLSRMMAASPLFVADAEQLVWRLAAWDLSQRRLE